MSAYPFDEKLGLGTPEDTVDLEQRANGQILTAEEAELAKLGYKQEFKREFSWFATFSFAFSISGLLATVCSTLEDTNAQVTSTFGFPLAAGGPPATVWCW